MKLKAALFISIVLNTYFAFVAFRDRDRPAPLPASTVPIPALAAPHELTQSKTQPKQFDWLSVEAEDYHVYIANLRGIGCPDETIQDIVIADVFKLFEEKKRHLRATAPRIQYWKSPAEQYRGDLLYEAAEADHKFTHPLDTERNNLLRTLGVDPTKHNLPSSMFDGRELLLDFLSAEKRSEVVQLFARLRDEASSVKTVTDPVQRQKMLSVFQNNSDARIKELLTPEEALHYDLRFSRTAISMRASLGGFEPTESEFIGIFKLRQPLDEARNAEIAERGGIPIEQVQAAKETLDQQIKSFLGESRFADFDRASDYGFQQLYKITQRSGQPTSTAVHAFQIQRAAMQKAYDLRQGNLDKAALDRALTLIRDETEATLQSTLGATTWDDYLNNGFAKNWLNDIARRN